MHVKTPNIYKFLGRPPFSANNSLNNTDSPLNQKEKSNLPFRPDSATSNQSQNQNQEQETSDLSDKTATTPSKSTHKTPASNEQYIPQNDFNDLVDLFFTNKNSSTDKTADNTPSKELSIATDALHISTPIGESTKKQKLNHHTQSSNFDTPSKSVSSPLSRLNFGDSVDDDSVLEKDNTGTTDNDHNEMEEDTGNNYYQEEYDDISNNSNASNEDTTDNEKTTESEDVTNDDSQNTTQLEPSVSIDESSLRRLSMSKSKGMSNTSVLSPAHAKVVRKMRKAHDKTLQSSPSTPFNPRKKKGIRSPGYVYGMGNESNLRPRASNKSKALDSTNTQSPMRFPVQEEEFSDSDFSDVDDTLQVDEIPPRRDDEENAENDITIKEIPKFPNPLQYKEIAPADILQLKFSECAEIFNTNIEKYIETHPSIPETSIKPTQQTYENFKRFQEMVSDEFLEMTQQNLRAVLLTAELNTFRRYLAQHETKAFNSRERKIRLKGTRAMLEEKLDKVELKQMKMDAITEVLKNQASSSSSSQSKKKGKSKNDNKSQVVAKLKEILQKSFEKERETSGWKTKVSGQQKNKRKRQQNQDD